MKKYAICCASFLLVACSREADPPFIGAEPTIPGALHTVAVSAVAASKTEVTLRVRNTGQESVCYFDAAFPSRDAARGIRIFSIGGEERLGRDTGLFADSDVRCLAPGQVSQLTVNIPASFSDGLRAGDCILFELPYFREQVAADSSFAEGVSLSTGGLVQAVWDVDSGHSLIPNLSADSCRRHSLITGH